MMERGPDVETRTTGFAHSFSMLLGKFSDARGGIMAFMTDQDPAANPDDFLQPVRNASEPEEARLRVELEERARAFLERQFDWSEATLELYGEVGRAKLSGNNNETTAVTWSRAHIAGGDFIVVRAARRDLRGENTQDLAAVLDPAQCSFEQVEAAVRVGRIWPGTGREHLRLGSGVITTDRDFGLTLRNQGVFGNQPEQRNADRVWNQAH